MLKTLFAAGQWVNVITLLAQILNNTTQVFPALASNPKFVMVQALIGALLPSLGGFAHKVAFAESQDPAKR